MSQFKYYMEVIKHGLKSKLKLKSDMNYYTTH